MKYCANVSLLAQIGQPNKYSQQRLLYLFNCEQQIKAKYHGQSTLTRAIGTFQKVPIAHSRLFLGLDFDRAFSSSQFWSKFSELTRHRDDYTIDMCCGTELLLTRNCQ